MNRISNNSSQKNFSVSFGTTILTAFLLISTSTCLGQATLKIINNFNSNVQNAANYFSQNYDDNQVWLYFLNTSGQVTYMDTGGVLNIVEDTKSIPLSKVKDGTFYLGIGENSTKVFAGFGTTTTSPFSGDNGPGIFDKDVPYALAEWTINGNEYDNTDLSYEDTFSFPTRLTVKNSYGKQTDQATFQAGTQAKDVIDSLKAAITPNKPFGPNNDNYPTSGAVGWGPLVPTISGNNAANRWIGSSKFWISGPDSGNLRSMYIYAPSLNNYLKFLQDNETSQFNNGKTGWFIDYDGNNGYSGYLTITGADQNYGLRIHDIMVNTGSSAATHWKADPTIGTPATGEITVVANNATIAFDSSTNVIGYWTDAVIYSGAALIGDMYNGPVITSTDDFASDGQYNYIVATMLASISASMATGLLGSDMYNTKIADTSSPGSTMYWFHTMTRANSVVKLFDNAWPNGEEYYDPFWKTMAELTNMQGYLSPFNDRWANFSPDFSLGANYTITWELGIPAGTSGDYSISGTVSGDIQQGVTLTLSGDASKTTTSAANGTYSFTNLPNGNYIVTPSLDGYSFSPEYRSVTIAGGNQSGKNFEATAITPNTHSISGTVSGDVKEGVTVTLSGDADNTTTTSAEGTYSFPNLDDGYYTVTPSLKGYSFSPSGRSVTISGSSKVGQDFTATGQKVAVGSTFLIEASDVHGLPNPDEFTVKPKVYTKYNFAGKEGVKANVTVLTKISGTTRSSFIDCLWAKGIRLYNRKDLKNAQKQGTSAATWAANPANQEILDMDLCLVSSEVAEQYLQPIALALPVITDISAGGQDAKGNNILIITGHWFGNKTLKIGREYTLDGEIKQQTMKIVKPTAADADLGYKTYKGKPSYMNYETGASKVVVIIPSKAPKGTLNGTIVMNNGVGIATGDAP